MMTTFGLLEMRAHRVCPERKRPCAGTHRRSHSFAPLLAPFVLLLLCSVDHAGQEAERRIHRDIVNSELAPAPKADRVTFPKDYQTTFKVLGFPWRTNPSPALVMTAYGNDLAASVTNAAHLPYPNGSIILMEFAEALKDSAGKPLLDASGRPQKGKVHHVDVMRRGEGF